MELDTNYEISWNPRNIVVCFPHFVTQDPSDCRRTYRHIPYDAGRRILTGKLFERCAGLRFVKRDLRSLKRCALLIVSTAKSPHKYMTLQGIQRRAAGVTARSCRGAKCVQYTVSTRNPHAGDTQSPPGSGEVSFKSSAAGGVISILVHGETVARLS